jgi:translation elongation factor EF-G
MTEESMTGNETQVNEVAEGQEQAQEIDVNALVARLEKLESTNERLLNESKQYKTKYQGLRTEVETKQKQQLEESENWKELLEIEKNRNFEVNESMKAMKQKVIKSNLHAEVARYAKNAHDINDVVSNLPKDLLNIDEENLRIEGIKEAVETVVKEKPYLFNTGVKNHGMSTEPPAEYKQETKEASLEDLLGAAFKTGSF